MGRVIRTIFLLEYLSDVQLRRQITASTNKVEAYNGFAKFLFFGGEGVIGEHDREEQEKSVKYNDLAANAVIFQNVVDMTYAIRDLQREGYPVTLGCTRRSQPLPHADRQALWRVSREAGCATHSTGCGYDAICAGSRRSGYWHASLIPIFARISA